MSADLDQLEAHLEAQLKQVQEQLSTVRAVQEMLHRSAKTSAVPSHTPPSPIVGPATGGARVRVPGRPRVKVSGGITTADRLKQWFRDNNNAPATTTQMSKAMDVSVSLIRQLVYTKHPGVFVNIGKADTRESLFQLTEGEAVK